MNDEMKPQQGLQHPDHEGQMAKSELYRAAKMSMKLFQMIQDGQQLEGWVQAKISKSADYLDSVYHYMEYQMKFGSGGVASSVDDITGDMEVGGGGDVAEEDNELPMEMEESMNYEQKLNALLESAVSKEKKSKAPFPSVASAKKNAETADMKPGEKKKSSSGGTITKTATSTIHKPGKGGYGNKWDGDSQDQAPAKSKAGKSAAEKKADRAKDIKLPAWKGNVTRHSSNKGAEKDDGTGDIKEQFDTANEGMMDKVKAGAKKAAKAVSKAITGPDDEELIQRLEDETGGKRPPKKEKKEESLVRSIVKKVVEAKKKGDGNLANNAKPYDKITKGDVIAGRLGKDEKGGKTVKEAQKGDGNLANNAKPYDKITKGDVIAGRLGKDEKGGKKAVKESAELDYMLKLAGRRPLNG
jgi:hypothetical protein